MLPYLMTVVNARVFFLVCNPLCRTRTGEPDGTATSPGLSHAFCAETPLPFFQRSAEERSDVRKGAGEGNLPLPPPSPRKRRNAREGKFWNTASIQIKYHLISTVT